MSPFSASAMGPPAAASGATWQIDRPEVPPENRPSVISAQARPEALALQEADVGYSISCMPGPPRGPSYLMTTTSPGRDRAAEDAVDRVLLALEHHAPGRRTGQISSGTPAVLTIAPSGARFPYSTARPPSAV